MFIARFQDGLVKEDEVGGASSSDAGMRNACNVSDGKSERKVSPGGLGKGRRLTIKRSAGNRM